MHNSEISEHLQQIMRKLSKKDKILYEQLLKKIDEIKNSFDVEHYKNLEYNIQKEHILVILFLCFNTIKLEIQ